MGATATCHCGGSGRRDVRSTDDYGPEHSAFSDLKLVKIVERRGAPFPDDLRDPRSISDRIEQDLRNTIDSIAPADRVSFRNRHEV